MNLFSKIVIVSVAVIASLYQFVLKTIIFDALGYGRNVSTIDAFNVRCERIDELGLEGCEDMWLHEPSGHLYMSCGNSQSRTAWFPTVDHLNASGRSLNDRIAVLDTRGHGRLATRIQWITPENFDGINGDGTLSLHGLDIWSDENSDTLRIVLVNHRPPIDPVTGDLLDAESIGANSTIEVFETQLGSSTMRHVKTYADSVIQTPNRPLWVNDHDFLFTNDHSSKLGLLRHLALFIGGGNVGYCSQKGCHIAAASGFTIPNGLTRDHDGLIYVPDTITGDVYIFELTEQQLLEKVGTIRLPYPIDNMSVDKNGDLFGAGFPQSYKLGGSFKKPFDVRVPGAVVRVRKTEKGGEKRALADYSIETILEDDGTVLPGTTVAVHDPQTGRFFLGGVMSPYITICEAR